jgi:hypothetical protein
MTDDDKPVTGEWLEEVSGGKWTHDFDGDFVRFKASLKIEGDGVELTVGKRSGYLSYITRGQFRAMCEVFQITMHGEQEVQPKGGA